MIFRLIILILLFLPSVNYAQNGINLKITVTGLKDVGGKLSVNLFNTESGFPEEAEKAYLYKTIDVNSESESVYFINIPAGLYAFAVLHDTNENGEMEKNFLGIPKEGFAFSNNYKPLVKSPSFSQAAFELGEKDTAVVVEMIYML
jgi:uncharacterized protein (DUF2141 family)